MTTEREALVSTGNSRLVRFDPSGERLVYEKYGTLKVTDVASGQDVGSFEAGFLTALDVSRDGRSVGCAHRDVWVWSWKERSRNHIGRHRSPGWSAALAISPDGGRVASAGATANEVKVWDLRTRTESVLVGHESSVDDVAWDPSGRLLYSASGDGTARRWHLS